MLSRGSRSQYFRCGRNRYRAMCAIASLTSLTILTDSIGARYSVDQSASEASIVIAERLVVTLHNPSVQHPLPATPSLSLAASPTALWRQQGFHCVAGAVTLSLGIECDAMGFLAVCIAINIDVTNAVKVRQNRHLTFGSDPLNQSFSTAWVPADRCTPAWSALPPPRRDRRPEPPAPPRPACPLWTAPRPTPHPT